MITVKGSHNMRKALAFIVLAHEGAGLQSRDLADLAGASPASTRTLLSRWCKWHYCSETMLQDGTRVYSLNSKGRRWLDGHWPELSSRLWEWTQELPPGSREYFAFLWAKEQEQ